MNIFKKVKQSREKFKKFQNEREQQKAIRTAERLKELKKKRLALEGRAKIYETEEKEKAKLKKVQQNLRKRTPLYRIGHAVKDQIKKNKSKKKKMGTLPGENMNWGFK